jgi:hypothetical protein
METDAIMSTMNTVEPVNANPTKDINFYHSVFESEIVNLHY